MELAVRPPLSPLRPSLSAGRSSQNWCAYFTSPFPDYVWKRTYCHREGASFSFPPSKTHEGPLIWVDFTRIQREIFPEESVERNETPICLDLANHRCEVKAFSPLRYFLLELARGLKGQYSLKGETVLLLFLVMWQRRRISM